ncbi:10804_t:CDS:2, partial [Paraglomus occultum]
KVGITSDPIQKFINVLIIDVSVRTGKFFNVKTGTVGSILIVLLEYSSYPFPAFIVSSVDIAQQMLANSSTNDTDEPESTINVDSDTDYEEIINDNKNQPKPKLN